MLRSVIGVKDMLPFPVTFRSAQPDQNPWSFAQWMMDIIGSLPIATAEKKFLIIVTDYFSNWVEAEAYASIKDKDVSKFI